MAPQGTPAPAAALQSYANHVHRPIASGAAALFTLAGLALAIVIVVRGSLLAGLALLSLGVAVSALVVISRTYIVRLQNRIIRLEMQLRLAGLGVGNALTRLSMPQIAALRFASDAELPGLTERAVRETLTGDQIKRAVTDWQGDFFRT